MEINNYNNQTFGARLGSSALFRLKNSGNTEMLSQLSKKLSTIGEPTTVVDVMAAQTSKRKIVLIEIV